MNVNQLYKRYKPPKQVSKNPPTTSRFVAQFTCFDQVLLILHNYQPSSIVMLVLIVQYKCTLPTQFSYPTSNKNSKYGGTDSTIN